MFQLIKFMSWLLSVTSVLLRAPRNDRGRIQHPRLGSLKVELRSAVLVPEFRVHAFSLCSFCDRVPAGDLFRREALRLRG